MEWLQEIKEFSSITEYDRFKKYLSERLSEGEIEEIEPKEYYQEKNLWGENKDRWFKDCSSKGVWRLVPPDFPFKGFFEKVFFPLDGYQEYE
jgi:hypothetical protein